MICIIRTMNPATLSFAQDEDEEEAREVLEAAGLGKELEPASN